MTDPHSSAISPPGWFTILSILALLWEAFGCFMYLGQIGVDPATLPLDQRTLWESTPTWSVAAYAVAVWVGLIGAVLLVMRRRLAVPLLLASLVAVVVQFSALLIVPDLAGNISSDMLLLPIVIFVVCYAIFHLALLARRRGWLQ